MKPKEEEKKQVIIPEPQKPKQIPIDNSMTHE
jgi:hypothetical protein